MISIIRIRDSKHRYISTQERHRHIKAMLDYRTAQLRKEVTTPPQPKGENHVYTEKP
jgi:hypothetical protein